jgi:hypothetical protein
MSNSLRPAWQARGNNTSGFQPPPAVASERSSPEDVDDGKPAYNRPRGRSLAELAARTAPEVAHRSLQVVASSSRTSTMTDSMDASTNINNNTAAAAPMIRFTRERLLSMRPSAVAMPEALRQLDNGCSVMLSKVALEPVCFDDTLLDADEIWATRRKAAVAAGSAATTTMTIADETRKARGREVGGAASGGRWERGVALPKPGTTLTQTTTPKKDADSPEELWDDPVTNESAAADFSAFGSMPTTPNEHAAASAFDFEAMTEQTRLFDKELHGGERSRSESDVSANDLSHVVKIDPKRPLAALGTTIRSGSGDDVNVFEDFDDPASEAILSSVEAETIKAAGADPSASSRLMDMIGVKREESLPVSVVAANESELLSPWGTTIGKPSDGPSGLPLNPWGGSLLSSAIGPSIDIKGLDIGLRSAASQQQEDQARLAELRRQEEEAQRRLAAQQAEERARQAAMQQQQAGVQSQVELVLLERITTILENQWGRSDLMSILNTLHAEDARVIPLLSNIDALRALIVRNQRRITIRSDPSIGSEIAILVMTNSQWQQLQQQDVNERAQEDALREQQQQQQHQMGQQQQQQRMAPREQRLSADAPWYYSDPQGNIQGPFRGNEMRQWLEAGYFKGDLPISQQPNGPFQALSLIFSNLSAAFVISGDSSSNGAELEKKARLEAQQRAQAEKAMREENERIIAREKAAAEQQRLAVEVEQKRQQRIQQEKADRLKAQQNGNESSAQLKMMLGLQQNVVQEKHLEPLGATKSPEKKTKPVKNAKVATTKPTQVAPENAAPAAPAWGAAAQSPIKKKSMSEIQNEEARAAAVAAMHKERTGVSSSGWANIAAKGGNTAWPSGMVKVNSSSVVSNIAGGASTLSNPASSSSVARPTGDSSAASSTDFGASMPAPLEKWCKEQMMKINGTDDLTLVSFCMTLSEPLEIRQYLTAYLGSTSQVNTFATDFLKKKGVGVAKQQAEWGTTAAAKKSRKKKGGGR